MKFSLIKHLSNYCRRVDSLKIFDTYGEKAGIAFYTIAHVAAIMVICTVSLALVDTERNGNGAMTQLNISSRLQTNLNKWNDAKLADAFAKYNFGFRPVMPFKRTRVTRFKTTAKTYNRASVAIPSVVNRLEKLAAYFPTELRKTVRAIANPKYHQARTICLNLQWEDNKKYRDVMMQDLCVGSRVNRGLSIVPWRYEEIAAKDQASCESSNGHWSRKNVCRVLRVATEVCGLVFPGVKDVAYLGGCFADGEMVKYKTLGFNETYSLTQIQAKLRHPADPIVTVLRNQESDSPVFQANRAAQNKQESAAGFSLLTLALMCVAAVLVTGVLSTGAYVKYSQRFVALKLQETPVPTAEMEMSDEAPLSLPVPSEAKA